MLLLSPTQRDPSKSGLRRSFLSEPQRVVVARRTRQVNQPVRVFMAQIAPRSGFTLNERIIAKALIDWFVMLDEHFGLMLALDKFWQR